MNYELIRQKRKTLSIGIKDGKVIVKAPRSETIEHIDGFVREKSRWITKKLAEYEKKTSALKSVCDGTQALIGGEFADIVITDSVKRVRFEDGRLLVPVKYEGAATASAVGNWYRRTAADMLSHMLEAMSIKTGLSYKSFALTNARGKWGSCDGVGNIRLNWRLVMLPDALTDYVMVHELCHTLHHDHSTAFWTEVKRYYPDAAAAKKQLKLYSVLTSLYR